MPILIFLMDKKGFYVTSALKPLERGQETIPALQSSIKPSGPKLIFVSLILLLVPFKINYLFYACGCFVFMYVSVRHTCMQCPQRSEVSIRSSGAGVSDGC